MKHLTTKAFGLWAATLLLAFATQFAHANPQQVVESLSSAQMKELFHNEGFTDVVIDSDDDLIVRMNGYRVLVFVRGSNYSRIKYVFAIGGTNATMDKVNDWNATKLFGRSYLDRDGDPVLEMDVDLDGGVTIARIRDSIRTFAQLQSAFLREVAH